MKKIIALILVSSLVILQFTGVFANNDKKSEEDLKDNLEIIQEVAQDNEI